MIGSKGGKKREGGRERANERNIEMKESKLSIVMIMEGKQMYIVMENLER